MIRGWGGVLGAVIVAIALASCGGSDTLPGKQRSETDNVLHFDANTPFSSLDPGDLKTPGSNVYPLLYSYLFVPDETGRLTPDLAREWRYDPKNRTLTIHLRNDAFFHNSAPVTSEDVLYSFETNLKKVRAALYRLVDKVSPTSDTTVQVHFKKDVPDFPRKIWDTEIVPAPSKISEDRAVFPVGSGPFKFGGRKGDSELVLVANKNYFNGPPSLDKVIFYYQPDREKAWTRILADQTDIAVELSPKNYEIIKQYEKRYYFDLYVLQVYTLLLYNTQDPLFCNPGIRRALTLAINRDHIVKNILKGYGKVSVGPMGVHSPYHNPDIHPLPYDPQRGLEILKKAGWSYDENKRCLTKHGRPFEFTMLVFKESQVEKEVGKYIRLCLNDLGIKVYLQALPFEELFKKYHRNNDFQAVITEFRGAYRDPEFVQELWTPSGSNKVSRAGMFEDPEVTRLVRKAIAEKDVSKQKKLFYKIEERMLALQPGTFLYHKTAIDVMSKRFQLNAPFSLTYQGIYRLREAFLNPASG